MRYILCDDRIEMGLFQTPSAMHTILNNLLTRLRRHNTSIDFGTVNLVKR
jgi:hypothetical protein